MAEAKEKRDENVGEKKRKREEKKQKKKDHERKDDENNQSQTEQSQKQNGKQKPQQNQVSGGSNNKKKKQKLVFPFGNYKNYYGYRIDEGLDEDPRLKVLKKEWFEGKDCLDIGCNSGLMTIHIAKKFNCRSILGIDIDPDRVSDAYWHLRKFSREHSGSCSTNVSKEQIRDKLNAAKKSTQSQLGEDKEMENGASICKGNNLYDAVSFRQENFVDNRHPRKKPYDVILCLSVAKWIHLNWGDDGLIKLFSEVWKLLLPGGIFILEPQPWDSYKKNYQVSEIAAENYRKIVFYPKYFREILLDKIGFRSVEDITSELRGSKAGFNRPIFAFHK